MDDKIEKDSYTFYLCFICVFFGILEKNADEQIEKYENEMHVRTCPLCRN